MVSSFGLDWLAAGARYDLCYGIIISRYFPASYPISLPTKLSTLVDVDTCTRYTCIRYKFNPLYIQQGKLAALCDYRFAVHRHHCRGIRELYAYPRCWYTGSRL